MDHDIVVSSVVVAEERVVDSVVGRGGGERLYDLVLCARDLDGLRERVLLGVGAAARSVRLGGASLVCRCVYLLWLVLLPVALLALFGPVPD